MFFYLLNSNAETLVTNETLKSGANNLHKKHGLPSLQDGGADSVRRG